MQNLAGMEPTMFIPDFTQLTLKEIITEQCIRQFKLHFHHQWVLPVIAWQPENRSLACGAGFQYSGLQGYL